MPYYPINEFSAKKIICQKWPNNLSSKIKIKTLSLQANSTTKIEDLNIFENQLLVLKPDQLFGKRFKNGLVFLGLNRQEVLDKIKELSTKEITLLSGHKGYLNNFIVETFIPNDNASVTEHYILINMEKDGDRLSYSSSGGVDIESNLTTLKSVLIPSKKPNDEQLLNSLLTLSGDQIICEFILEIYHIFVDNGFMELELNPFVLDNKDVWLLDCVAKLDKYEVNLNKNYNFEVYSFGLDLKTNEENKINQIDEASPASLKLTVLNPNGRVWGLYSGGGASMALFDTLGTKCDFSEVANYGEYSGNPTFGEVYSYTNQVLSLISKTSHGKTNILLIGGGTANFTDVKETLEGISKAIADNNYKLDLKTLRVFLRRGGPNCEAGIAFIKNTCQKLEIPFVGYGPKEPLCKIIDEVSKEFNINN